MKRPAIPFPVVVRREERDAYICHQVEDYWVGHGFVGQRESNSRPPPKLRRFLRVRDADGICSYFFWTKPRRGELLPKVYNFKKRIKITRELAERHFQIEK